MRHLRIWIIGLALALVATATPATAQRRNRGRKKPAATSATKKKASKSNVKVFNFSGIDVAGQMRTPQLLYFLDRASEELERASLKKRSFIPEMVRTLEEESL